MKTLKLMAAALSFTAAATVLAQEPPWNASATLPYGLGNGWTPGSGH